ncbi:41885_t:CDS:2 [Gigaspora margarita]|uniref:41885_t:CDS:1 n=1 Tax=Gigaspora margarita TaxID=4874 RepID=A0ABN7VC02_GIGMA|nr:41885_t:CDS:2 [Gigaspora margarita]
MNSQNISRNTQRKCKERMNVTLYQREMGKYVTMKETNKNDNHKQTPQASASNNIEENDNYEQISQASASNIIEQGNQNMDR